MKVFLDTNVWMSATVFSGLCEALVLQCAEHHRLLSSALVQQEAHDVLRRKFPQVPHACALFDAAWQAAELIADHAAPPEDNDRRNDQDCQRTSGRGAHAGLPRSDASPSASVWTSSCWNNAPRESTADEIRCE